MTLQGMMRLTYSQASQNQRWSCISDKGGRRQTLLVGLLLLHWIVNMHSSQSMRILRIDTIAYGIRSMTKHLMYDQSPGIVGVPRPFSSIVT
jgi:hypothetical protein